MLSNFRSYQMAKKLYFECEKLRMREHLRLQLLRASSSICLNLAEGSGKNSAKDQRRFYFIALGSLREVQAILELSRGPESVAKLASALGGCLYRLCQNSTTCNSSASKLACAETHK